MAECFVIYSKEIEGRLDPLYYSGDVFSFLKKSQYEIKTIGAVSLYLKTGFPAGALQQEYGENGIIQIRPTNIDQNGLLKFDKNIYVKKEYLKRKDDLLQRREVLFNNTNSQELVGKTAFFDLEGTYFCSNHVTRIKVNEKSILPKYLWTILNIYQERKIFYSLCTNWNNQSGVNIELLKTVKIPLPNLETQRRVVEIVEKAFLQKQRKESEIQDFIDSTDDCLLEELEIKMPGIKNKQCFPVWADKVESSRLDPYYYQEEFLALVDALSSIKCKTYDLGELIIDMSGGATPHLEENHYAEGTSGIPFLRVQNVAKEGLVLDDVKYITKEVHNGMLKRSQLKPFDLVFTITGRLGSVAVIPENFDGNINQHSVRFHLKAEINGTKVNPFYVAAYLNSKIGNKLSNRGITGGTRPALDYEYIKSIRIPIPTLEIQNTVANEVKKRIDGTHKLRAEAINLIKQAKSDVMGMILGK